MNIDAKKPFFSANSSSSLSNHFDFCSSEGPTANFLLHIYLKKCLLIVSAIHFFNYYFCCLIMNLHFSCQSLCPFLFTSAAQTYFFAFCGFLDLSSLATILLEVVVSSLTWRMHSFGVSINVILNNFQASTRDVSLWGSPFIFLLAFKS